MFEQSCTLKLTLVEGEREGPFEGESVGFEVTHSTETSYAPSLAL